MFSDAGTAAGSWVIFSAVARQVQIRRGLAFADAGGYGHSMRRRDLQVLHGILETRGGFTHRDHVELAWSYLRLYSIDDAAEIMAAAIRHVARRHGAEDKYPNTITRAWLHFVAVHIERCGADSFEAFIDRNPDLLDSQLIQHFYSRELLFSEPARASWTAPDLRQLPALA
jgi:hypothetical protein